MTISNSNFFLSLFNSDSSGTIVVETRQFKVEFDVKHFAPFDKESFFLENTKVNNPYCKRIIQAFIPLRLGCQGIKINCFIRPS